MASGFASLVRAIWRRDDGEAIQADLGLERLDQADLIQRGRHRFIDIGRLRVHQAVDAPLALP